MAKTRARLGSATVAAPQTSQKAPKQDNNSGVSSDDDGGGAWMTVTAKKTTKKVKYTCGGGTKVCGRIIGENEDCIMCEACGGWFHPSCQDLSSEAFKALGKFDLLWLCSECRQKLSTMLDVAKRVESRVAEAEKRIVEAVQKTQKVPQLDKNLEEKILNLETEVVKQMSAQKEALISTSQSLKKVVQSQGSMNREMNIIIHNIPESDSLDSESRKTHDITKFDEVSKGLCGSNTEIKTDKIIRLGKKREEEGAKPRLMLVKLKDKEDVEKLFGERFKLKDAGFQNIYITKDLEPEERERQKKLREEWIAKGKDSHRIFRGKVVPRV